MHGRNPFFFPHKLPKGTWFLPSNRDGALATQVSNISVFVESPCRTRVSKISRVRSVILLEFTLSVETIKDA